MSGMLKDEDPGLSRREFLTTAVGAGGAMLLANATNFYRKSGVAQWRDLRFSFSSHADPLAPGLFGPAFSPNDHLGPEHPTGAEAQLSFHSLRPD
jgi:hypothetical protein